MTCIKNRYDNVTITNPIYTRIDWPPLLIVSDRPPSIMPAKRV